MNPLKFGFWSFSGSILFWLLASYPAAAEIIPDTTLPVNSTVTLPQSDIRLIEGGTPAGNNLFHSFQEFSFSGGTALFNNDMAVRNIITRVTGGLPSNINGIIGANGIANLFFINPNGIVFGPNAALQIGGSFVASTANSLKFADGTEFSATAPQTSPLLTVSVPIGLQFGSNPGSIVNQSQASANGEVTDAIPPNGIVGLKVPMGKTLALVGGNLTLEGGNLTTTGGRIELGSVAGTGLVNLREIEKGYALDYAVDQNFGDIQISKNAIVYGSRGGDIQLQGRNVNITEGSIVSSSALEAATGGNIEVNASKLRLEEGGSIATFALGEGQAGNVSVRASDSVELVGETSDGFPSGLGSQVIEEATGNGGNLTIETGKLLIQGGAVIEASSFGAGSAGNVLVTASDSIEVIGRTSNNGASGIAAQVAREARENAGNAGNVTLETRRLTVLEGAQISVAAQQNGNGGNLTINASDSIQLSGASRFTTAELLARFRSGLFVLAGEGATGNVGSLKLTTGVLTVENGARISADNLGSGQQEATQTLNVRQLIIRDGGEVRSGSFAEGAGGTLNVNATESVQVIGTRTIGSTTVPSILFSEAQGTGKAGNLNITTPRLNVQDGAEVTVSSRGSGSAGNLTITANDVRLNGGSLTAETNAGEGANITLENLDLLLLQNRSQISAQAFNNATGGNINIDAANGFIVAVPGQDNDIIANASQGQGGRIDITSQGNFGIAERKSTPPNTTNDIDASSEFGFAGTVTINTLDVDPSRGLITLPAGLLEPTRLVASSCAAFTANGGSQFIVTGRGGLPPTPDDFLSSDVVWSDTRLTSIGSGENPKVSNNTLQVQTQPKKSDRIVIVPATGWVFNGKGEVTLIGQSLDNTPQQLRSTSGSCLGN